MLRALPPLLLALTVHIACEGWAAEALRVSKPDVRREILGVIEAQLAAFRKGELARAHGYAAAELRAQKPLQVFTAIVKQNYPEIWANERAEFGIVRDDGQRASVTVQVYSKTGDTGYDFTLVRERPGWRIHGVLRHSPPKAGKM